jgi:N-acetylmuramoyl-L-alanine amidase
MSKKIIYFALALVMLATLSNSVGDFPKLGSAKQFLASLVFPEKISPQDLKDTYSAGKIKILVVPGHDNKSKSGTYFNGVKEARLNLLLANKIQKKFALDPKFEISITRDAAGYKPDFATYFTNNRSAIETFRDRLKTAMSKLTNQGLVEKKSVVHHNSASNEDAIKLYGINKWANDNNMDLVLHVHFNDYPRRWKAVAGKYSGFSIYIPEKQLPNYRTSNELASKVLKQMNEYFPINNNPKESEGIIEDQELIAIGSNASLNSAALLIEYGFIYESQFTDMNIQPLIMDEFAYQTYLGIAQYFDDIENKNKTATLPYSWNKYLESGMKNNVDIFAMQVALAQEGFYPPKGFKENDCPITGNFGKCTYSAIVAFQITIGKLNELYSK